jgi:GTPase SAR1 family protein
MPFAQLLLGPPGAGKTTYCAGMQQYMHALGRECAVINLDPANDTVPYACAVDIGELITITDVMDSMQLGPNGALLYCLEYLEENIEWLLDKLASPELKDKYLLFDFPGQVELYTNHTSLRNIVTLLTSNKHSFRMCAVHLVDSHHCSDPSKFISVLLLALSTMCHLELPHINVLSKIDLIEAHGELLFGLDYYTDVLDLKFLLERMDDESTNFTRKFAKLNAAICELVEDYSLVHFSTLNVQDKESVGRLLTKIDKANGYIFGAHEKKHGVGSAALHETMMTMDPQEVHVRYVFATR